MSAESALRAPQSRAASRAGGGERSADARGSVAAVEVFAQFVAGLCGPALTRLERLDQVFRRAKQRLVFGLGEQEGVGGFEQLLALSRVELRGALVVNRLDQRRGVGAARAHGLDRRHHGDQVSRPPAEARMAPTVPDDPCGAAGVRALMHLPGPALKSPRRPRRRPRARSPPAAVRQAGCLSVTATVPARFWPPRAEWDGRGCRRLRRSRSRRKRSASPLAADRYIRSPSPTIHSAAPQAPEPKPTRDGESPSAERPLTAVELRQLQERDRANFARARAVESVKSETP